MTRPRILGRLTWVGLLCLALAASLAACAGDPTPTAPTAAPTPTTLSTEAPEPGPTAASTPTALPTETPAPAPTAAPTPTSAPTPAPIPTPTFAPNATPIPAKYSVESVDVEFTGGGQGLVQTSFSVTVRNVGELPGAEPVKLELAVDDDDSEPVSMMDPLAAGEASPFELSRGLAPGHHRATFIVADSEMSVDVHAQAADITLTALRSVITGDGAVALEVQATNQGDLIADSVALSAVWVPRADDAAAADGSSGSTEAAAVIERLNPGESRIVGLPVEIPTGSYAFTLRAETESIEAFQDNNSAETTVEVDYVELVVSVESARHAGYEQDGDGIVEMDFSVANEGVAESGELTVGIMCSDGGCFQSLTLDSLQAGDSMDAKVRVAMPLGASEALVFAGGLDEGYRWGEGNVGKVAVNVVERATVRPAQDAETVVVGGYWSDGTANVEATPSLGRANNQGVTVTCSQVRETVSACREQTLVWPADGPGPFAETLIMRLPMGESYALEFDYGGNKRIVEVEAPERILGVERDVWECFSDTSNVGTNWWGLGIGCAGWSLHTVTKWDQSAPVTVWANPAGDPRYIRILKEILEELSPIVNIQFHWVATESEADFVAHVGLYSSEARDFGVGCGGGGIGCAGFAAGGDGVIRSGSLVALGKHPEERAIRELILHEALHVLMPLPHRQRDSTSVMSYYPVADQTVIDHMDEALFRLYSDPLVKPGMTMDQVREVVALRDKLLDRPAPASLTPLQMLQEAHARLQDAGSVRYTISWGQDSYWPDYEVANYQFERPRWTHVNDGSNHYYMIDYWEREMWRQVSGDWKQVEWDNPVQTVPADVSRYSSLSPHYALLLILEDYNRVEVEILGHSDGNVTLKAQFDPGVAPGGGIYTYSSAEVVIVLDEESYEIREYSFKSPRSDDFHAENGRYGIEIEFPEAVIENSENLSSCRSETLGLLFGTVTLNGRLPGSCGPNPKRNLRQHHFSLDRLTGVNITMKMISENAAAFSDGSLVALRLLEGEEMLAGNGLFESPGKLRLDNVQLPAGDYTIELEAFDPRMQLEYELEVSTN